jgi:CRISPR-associated protein Csb2
MALAIEVELLTGRYVATRFNDRARAEWPPHPARLFSAAVAVWADSERRSETEERVLRWLERQPAPQIACSDDACVSWREGATHFVPINDASAVPSVDATYALARAAVERGSDAARSPQDVQAVLRERERAMDRIARNSRKANERTLATGAIQLLPDERPRQARSFPSVRPPDARVVYAWPAAAPDAEQRAALDGLFARVGRLGHSTSLVSCRVTDDDLAVPTLVPDDHGSHAIRVTGDGQLTLLEQEFARHQGNDPRALPAAMQAYSPAVVTQDVIPGTVFSPRFTVVEIDRETPVSMLGSLALARAVRAAILESAGRDVPALLSGLRVDGDTGASRPADRPHIAIVPLPCVGRPHADGAVRGVAFVEPEERDAERAAALAIIWRWVGDGVRAVTVAGREVMLRRSEGYTSLATLRPGRWCEPSCSWATVTPIALDRWPGDLHDGDAAVRAAVFAGAEQLVVCACAHVGLPQPVRVAVGPDAFVSAVAPAHRFPSFRTPNGGPRRPLVHTRVTFEQAVRGPVLLGAGRYVGQGLCMPLESPRA